MLPVTRASALGLSQVASNQTTPRLCLDMLQRNEDSPYNLGVYLCHNYVAASQVDVTQHTAAPCALLHFLIYALTVHNMGMLRTLCSTVIPKHSATSHEMMDSSN